ncbi:hypothetical protein BT96DRAFT_274092 [Gymnopus androsaceus JB14]|uniref:Uncharacterized protein n=1 Tax=Gymnopus androsaceus JB14 TaxID=1447944 RepID=A0A6A4H575_9AGAR|nr:hypothetical protein BT96DRAFT_274092 [Gymnopus androsaceus JB14]
MFSEPPTINMDSAVGQTTSEPTSPVEPHRSFHRHTGSDPELPLPHNSLTPPSKPHWLSFGSAGGNLSPDRASRLASASSFSLGRSRSAYLIKVFPFSSREGSRESTDTNHSWQ